LEITADRLILAAGTFGSTYLLLKNREAFPAISPALGTQFCGNGDLLTFALNCRRTVDGRRASRLMDPSFGPVITSAIRVPDALDGGGAEGRGLYVEDAGVPAFVSWVLETSDQVGIAKRLLLFLITRLRSVIGGSPRSNLSSDVRRLFGGCTRASTSLPLLGMGRDVPSGRMRLREGWLDVDWREADSDRYFRRLRSTMQAMARVWQADFRDNLIWYLKRVITVHPLGGCPMGRNDREGVVSEFGEVFNYPGMYVADGSVMPGPVGANPALTIAALSDRFADRILQGWRTNRQGAAGRSFGQSLTSDG
jgi:cholesterol oxidase